MSDLTLVERAMAAAPKAANGEFIRELGTRIADLETERDKAERERFSYGALNKGLTNRIAELEAKWAHTVDALRAANERIAEHEAEIVRLKTAVTEWGDAAHRQAAEVARLTEALAAEQGAFKSAVAANVEERAIYMAEITQLRAEIARLTAALAEAEAKIFSRDVTIKSQDEASDRREQRAREEERQLLGVPPDRERLIASLAELGTELMDAEWDAVELINDTIAALRSPAPAEREEMARHLLIIAGSGVSMDYDRFVLREAAALLRALPLPPQEE
jgi:chromosome segregation ATPase